MPRYKNLNGVRVQLTAEEEATRDTEEKIWSDAKSTRQLAEIRRIRNEKLSETDYLAMSDNIMSENMIDFRKQLRDIPQDYSEADYDDLLARDEQGNLTHTVWEKP
jgi:RNA-splicing ligase RtcB